jgi:hypothetical protein
MSLSRVLAASSFLSLALSCKTEPGSLSTTPPTTTDPSATTSTAPTEPAAPAQAPALTPEQQETWKLLGDELDGRRSVVMKYGQLRYASEGPIAHDGGGEAAWETVPMVDAAGQRFRVRIVARGSRTNLLVWIDVKDVAPQLFREVTLEAGTGKPKIGDGGVDLAPGEQLEIVEHKGTRVHVRTRDGRFTGWIDAGALDPSYEPKPFALPILDVLLPGKTHIAVRPGGRPLHTLAPNENGKWEGHVLQEPNGGWLLVEHVEFCHPTVRVRGWVRAKAVERVTPDSGAFGCGEGKGTVPVKWGELEQAPVVELAADARLYSPEGELVGRTLGPAKLRRGPDGLVRVPTFWGFVPVKTEP